MKLEITKKQFKEITSGDIMVTLDGRMFQVVRISNNTQLRTLNTTTINTSLYPIRFMEANTPEKQQMVLDFINTCKDVYTQYKDLVEKKPQCIECQKKINTKPSDTKETEWEFISTEYEFALLSKNN